MALLLETVWGDLVIDLDDGASEELRCNFLKLAAARFFTNTLVYAVTPNRFCQLGDPVGDGTGGTSIHGLLDHNGNDPDNENHTTATTTTTRRRRHDYRTSSRRFLASTCGRPLTNAEERQRKGLVVATCASGIPNTIGSQFLITTAGGLDHALDGYWQKGRDDYLFVVLGQVVDDDHHVLDKINAAFLDPDGRPYADIRILRALPVYDPYDDPPGLERYLTEHVGCRKVETDDKETTRITYRSPSPGERPDEELVPKRISAADVEAEGLDNDNDDDYETLQRRLAIEQEKTEKAHDQSRAVVLEMLGDLPDADITAPDNVLFLCKLNPVTVDEDLELILARFDESVQVEIIRDPDTGASLQYAFAEFATKRQAEEAYFKMNNALIDDRRIKVDFSQSVAKLWDKYHQRLRRPPKPLPPPPNRRIPPPNHQRSTNATVGQQQQRNPRMDDGRASSAARPRHAENDGQHRLGRDDGHYGDGNSRRGGRDAGRFRSGQDDDYRQRGRHDDIADDRKRNEHGRRRPDHAIGTPPSRRENSRATQRKDYDGKPGRRQEDVRSTQNREDRIGGAPSSVGRDDRRGTLRREDEPFSGHRLPRDDRLYHHDNGDQQNDSPGREHRRSTHRKDDEAWSNNGFERHDDRRHRRQREERGGERKRLRRHDDDVSDEESSASASSRGSSEESRRRRHRKKKHKKKKSSSDQRHDQKKSSKREHKHQKKHHSRSRSSSPHRSR